MYSECNVNLFCVVYFIDCVKLLLCRLLRKLLVVLKLKLHVYSEEAISRRAS